MSEKKPLGPIGLLAELFGLDPEKAESIYSPDAIMANLQQALPEGLRERTDLDQMGVGRRPYVRPVIKGAGVAGPKMPWETPRAQLDNLQTSEVLGDYMLENGRPLSAGDVAGNIHRANSEVFGRYNKGKGSKALSGEAPYGVFKTPDEFAAAVDAGKVNPEKAYFVREPAGGKRGGDAAVMRRQQEAFGDFEARQREAINENRGRSQGVTQPYNPERPSWSPTISRGNELDLEMKYLFPDEWKFDNQYFDFRRSSSFDDALAPTGDMPVRSEAAAAMNRRGIAPPDRAAWAELMKKYGL